MSYQHFFFDLDRTLWDFDTNAKETLEEAYDHFQLSSQGIPSPNEFRAVYMAINEGMWAEYRKGQISKQVLRDERFTRTLQHFGSKQLELGIELGDYYLDQCPRKQKLMPGTMETLDYLKQHYELHIITNGFTEAQSMKLDLTGLGAYFRTVVTSEMVGVKKPAPGIFDFALKQAGASAASSIMIGDSPEIDLVGARNIGMGQIFYNPEDAEEGDMFTHSIRELSELVKLF